MTAESRGVSAENFPTTKNQVTCKIKWKLNFRNWFFQYLRLCFIQKIYIHMAWNRFDTTTTNIHILYTYFCWCISFQAFVSTFLTFNSRSLLLLMHAPSVQEREKSSWVECRLFSRFILVKMIRQTSATFHIHPGSSLLYENCWQFTVSSCSHCDSLSSSPAMWNINRAKHLFSPSSSWWCDAVQISSLTPPHSLWKWKVASAQKSFNFLLFFLMMMKCTKLMHIIHRTSTSKMENKWDYVVSSHCYNKLLMLSLKRRERVRTQTVCHLPNHSSYQFQFQLSTQIWIYN